MIIGAYGYWRVWRWRFWNLAFVGAAQRQSMLACRFDFNTFLAEARKISILKYYEKSSHRWGIISCWEQEGDGRGGQPIGCSSSCFGWMVVAIWLVLPSVSAPLPGAKPSFGIILGIGALPWSEKMLLLQTLVSAYRLPTRIPWLASSNNPVF